MIDKIINDCEQALNNNLYFAALNLALTLPDICAKAKFPNERSNRRRYVDWYEDYIGQYNKPPQHSDEEEINYPYPSGEVIYSLRCSMLHQGTPNVRNCGVTRFELVVEKSKSSGFYACDSMGLIYHGDEEIASEREIRINVHNLCRQICDVVKHYYDDNKEQFNFFNYHLLDWDEVSKQQITLGRALPCPEYMNEGGNDE